MATPGKVRGGIATFGTIAGYFTKIQGLKGGPITVAAGVILHFLPKSDPGKLSNIIKVK